MNELLMFSLKHVCLRNFVPCNTVVRPLGLCEWATTTYIQTRVHLTDILDYLIHPSLVVGVVGGGWLVEDGVPIGRGVWPAAICGASGVGHGDSGNGGGGRLFVVQTVAPSTQVKPTTEQNTQTICTHAHTATLSLTYQPWPVGQHTSHAHALLFPNAQFRRPLTSKSWPSIFVSGV